MSKSSDFPRIRRSYRDQPLTGTTQGCPVYGTSKISLSSQGRWSKTTIIRTQRVHVHSVCVCVFLSARVFYTIRYNKRVNDLPPGQGFI